MGLFICKICDAHLPISFERDVHKCDMAVVEKRIEKLEYDRNIAERKLDKIRDSIFFIIQSLPSLDPKEITVETELIRKLWKVAECRDLNADTADSFLCQHIAYHRILCESFGIFKSKEFGKSKNLLEKLKEVYEACLNAKKVLGYEDSKFDLTPEELI